MFTRLTRLAPLAALWVGCTCAKKADGPVPRPPRAHAWASLANLEQTFGDVATLASRVGFGSVGKASLRDLLGKESGLGPDLLAEVDLSRPVWSVAVKGESPASSYTYVYSIALRDEQKFLTAMRKVMDEAKVGAVLKLTPKGAGAVLTGPLFMVTGRGHALVCQEAASLEVAREWMLRSLGTEQAKEDIALTFTSEFMASWQPAIADLTNALGSPLEGFAKRMAARAGSIRELSVRVDLAPEAVVVSVGVEAAEGGAMHQVIKRQVLGPAYGVGSMPQETWLYYADRYSEAALAESALDVRQALGGAPVPKRDELQKAIAAFVGVLSGEISFATGGPALLGVAKVKDAAAARAAVDALIAVFTGASEVRRDGALAVVDLPFPGGFVPPLIAGRPAVASFVDGDRLLVGLGVDAEARVKEAATGAGDRLDKNAAFAKAVPGRPGRVGVLYVSVAQMLRSMVSAVPGAPAPAVAADSPGILLEWGVNEARTSMDITLRAPVEAFAALGPILGALPFGRGGGGWKPGP